MQLWHPVEAIESVLRPPLLLLHDSLGCVTLWRDFPALLCSATGRRIVAYDRLGFGASAVRKGCLPLDFIEQESEDWPLLQQALGFDEFVALGHSVGGGMALCGAARWPKACRAVITLAAQAFPEPQTLAGIRAARKFFALPEQRTRLAKYHGKKVDWVLQAWIETWLDPNFQAWSLQPTLPLVRCPLLLIHGKNDEYGSCIHPNTIARHSTGQSEQILLPDVGHNPHREQTQPVVTAIKHFLQRHP